MHASTAMAMAVAMITHLHQCRHQWQYHGAGNSITLHEILLLNELSELIVQFRKLTQSIESHQSSSTATYRSLLQTRKICPTTLTQCI